MTAIRPLAVCLGVVTIAAAGCASAPPTNPRRAKAHEPPPRALAVTFGGLTLRASAYAELHAWLASAARSSAPVPNELEGAERVTARALRDDARDRLLGRTMRDLARCENDECARQALDGTAFVPRETEALQPFVARFWSRRAEEANAGIDAIRAAGGSDIEPIVKLLATDLGIAWPDEGATVPVVSEAPAPGREAIVPAALSAKGSCFMGRPHEPLGVYSARVIDCALAYATLPLASRSEFATELSHLLPAEDALRAWELVVVHAVAVRVTVWEHRHVSAMRKSAVAEEERTLAWLAEHWKERLAGQSIPMFAMRLAEAYRDAHAQ